MNTPHSSDPQVLKTVLYKTFGCKLNFAETATIQTRLEQEGMTTFHDNHNGYEKPDVIVVNTCSVTETADKKCKQYIRSMNRRFPQAAIVVTGCYAQLKGEEAAELPGVRIVAGSDRKDELPEMIKAVSFDSHDIFITPTDDMEKFVPSCARGDRTRYFLKVQDGCDYRCSYCTIPKARGKSRSPEINDLISQAQEVSRTGGKEIVLTGVNIGDFGKRRDETFLDLIEALDDIDGIERYRISSIEPNLLTDEIIDFCSKSKRFMPHFHIPLQSGSNTVLGLMRRRYKSELFRERILKIRNTIPDAFIGIDLIVGSRGETPELFEESKTFIENLDISRLHVFAYSERPGTDALKIPYKVNAKEQSLRVQEMLSLSERKLKNFSERFVDTIRPVLLEHGHNMEKMGGFTDNYLRVEIPARPELDNKVVRVKLESLDPSGEFFLASIVNE